MISVTWCERLADIPIFPRLFFKTEIRLNLSTNPTIGASLPNCAVILEIRTVVLLSPGELWPSLPHIFIRSPRRSLTAHASSDYWDQTGENTHTHLHTHSLLTSCTLHTCLAPLLTPSLMSHHRRRADCRDPEAEDRGLALRRYTHCLAGPAASWQKHTAAFCRGHSRSAWRQMWFVWEEKRERVCLRKFKFDHESWHRNDLCLFCGCTQTLFFTF